MKLFLLAHPEDGWECLVIHLSSVNRGLYYSFSCSMLEYFSYVKLNDWQTF